MDKSSLSEYQIETLINMVEERPCIWDKTCNKDSAKKNSAWIEIFNYFSDGNWDNMSANDRKHMDLELIGKWINLRDTFTKLVKKGREKKYRHYNRMKFLVKNIEVDPAISSSEELDGSKRASPELNEDNVSEPVSTSDFRRIEKTSPSIRIELNKKRKRPSYSTTLTRMPRLEGILAPNPSLMVPTPSPHHAANNNSNSTPEPNYKSSMSPLDEDEAFFISIMPSVKKLTNMSKLEFRIGVLDILRRIAQSE